MVVRVPAIRTVESSGKERAVAIGVGGSPDGDGEPEGATDGVGDGVGDGSTVGDAVAVGVGDGVGVGVGEGDGVGLAVGVGEGVGPGLGVGLGVVLAVGVGVGVGVGGGLAVGVAVGDGAGLDVGLGVGLPTGIGAAARFCGFGDPWTRKSAALSFESIPLPAAPPGRRSPLEPAAGAGMAVVSTKAFVASPQPTASIGAPPIGRSTNAPPVAANPPEYVTSAVAAKMPAVLAMRMCWPAPSGWVAAQVALRVTVEPVDVT